MADTTTNTDLKATLTIVMQFLEAGGFAGQPSLLNVKNGRWIYEWCRGHVTGSICPCGVSAALKELFTLLEQGTYVDGTPLVVGSSEWTRACTNAALRAGGFPEWSQDQ